MSDAGKETFAEKLAQNKKSSDTGPDPSTAYAQAPADVSGTLGAGGALAGATVGDYGSGGAGGMSGGIEGGTAGKSGQERKDVAGTGAGSGNSSADTAGRQIEGASGQGLSGQGGVF